MESFDQLPSQAYFHLFWVQVLLHVFSCIRLHVFPWQCVSNLHIASENFPTFPMEYIDSRGFVFRGVDILDDIDLLTNHLRKSSNHDSFNI